MPRILRHTPKWLERPATGFKLFNDASAQKLANGHSSKQSQGVSRTIAHRGSEVFVAVGNQLRWSDLVYLREQDYHKRKGDLHIDETGENADQDWDDFRVRSYWHSSSNPLCLLLMSVQLLKVPVHREIRQLVVSPQGDYIAILTSHTVHVAFLPDSELLTADTDPLKLKTWQVGPTAHVVERAPVVSAKWHPLAEGPCLVTVTEDAIVRMWELNSSNRWSFDNPSIPLDLRKLANTDASSEDYSPSKYGTSIGFSPDQFDMEAAAACFGGSGAPDEAGWATSTLWIAMRNGDIYALCPFLPSRWLLTQPQLSYLSALVDSNGYNGDVGSVTDASRQQAHWTAEILQQQRQQDMDDLDGDCYVFDRPAQPGLTPILQGPYYLEPDSDHVFDVTDIFAIAPDIPQNNTNTIEGSEVINDSLSISVICVATSDGLVHVCLDTNDTQAEWVPNKPDTTSVEEASPPPPELLVLESVRVCESPQPSWIAFSATAELRSSLYVSHGQGVSYISPTSALEKLANEMDGDADPSSDFRLRLLAQSDEIEILPIIQVPLPPPTAQVEPVACIHVHDSDVGHFVLTVRNGQPHAAILDFSDLELLFDGEDVEHNPEDDFQALHAEENRPSFTVPPELFAETTLPLFAEDQRSGQSRQIMDKEIRLASGTVDMMMKAHRLLGSETGKLQDAVSSLFQRCERMRDELQAQLERVGEISSKIDAVLDDNAEVPEEDEDATHASVMQRMDDARSRHVELEERYKQLRNKVSELDRRPLNDKERRWIQETDTLQDLIVPKAEDARNGGQSQPRQRYNEVKSVKDDLVRRSSQLKGSQDVDLEDEASPRRHKQRMNQVSAMLERETALVDATMVKLEQLKMLA